MQEHQFSVLGYNYFLLEVTNNADIDISFESNALGKDASGNNVAAKSSSLGIIDYIFQALILWQHANILTMSSQPLSTAHQHQMFHMKYLKMQAS
jgi:hypothetical protein